MSLMKRFAEDKEELTLRAMQIAWHPDDAYREAAITLLFRDCGKAANVYASPAEVAALFVHHVAETYAAEFMAQRESV